MRMADIPTSPTSRRPRTAPVEPPARMPPDHVGVLIAAFFMMIGGWAGLYLLVTNNPPRLGAELWIFFVLLHVAVTGTVLPVVRYFNALFARVEIPPGGVIVRQSVWIALFVVVCAWLQILRVLSLPVAFFLALVFIVLEVFLRVRENSDEDD
jgi:hypothetical protein